MTIGERIRAARESRGLALQALAERTGLAADWLAAVEAGRERVTAGALGAIARQLDTPIATLIGPTPRAEIVARLNALLRRS